MKSMFISSAPRASKRTTLLAAAAAIAALAAPRFATAAADFSSVWNGGTGSWNDPAQWTPALVPNNGAQTFDASIAAGTANLASNVLLEKLNVTGGVIASPSATPYTITANDIFTWSGGQFENSNVVAGAGANLSGSPTSSMLGLTIPAGKSLTSSGGTFQITRSTINNNGAIQINGATAFNTSSGTTFFRGTINNAGAMNVNAATSLSNVAFNNSGTISLAAPLTLNGGGTWTGGSITSPGGFALTFTGNSHVLDAASNIPGTMPLNIQGSVTFDFPMVRTAPTQLKGGTMFFKKPVSFPAGGPALQIFGNANFDGGATIDVPLTLFSARIEGATINRPWTMAVEPQFGGSCAIGDLDVSNGVTSNAALTKSASLVIWGPFVNNSTITASSPTFAGDALFQNNGSVTMTAGVGIQFNAETNTVNAVGATIQTGSTGQFLGTMTNRGSITTGGATTVGTALHNFGSVAISAGNLTLQGALDNHGTINVASGSMAVDQPYGGGAIFAQYTGASTTLNGGAGTLTVTRSILRAYAASPGDADDPGTTGAFTLNGNLILNGIGSERSRLEIELGGTTQGGSYDFFDVNGTASVDAVIDIRLVNSFQNSISSSDVFTVLTADAPITGTVRNPWIGGPPGRVITADGLGSFLVSFSGNNLVLSDFSTAVPEPASMAVIAFAGAVIGLTRRRPRARSTIHATP